MEIKIGRYLFPLIIGTIFAFFLIIIFSIKDISNNINENALEKKYAQMNNETQKDVELLYKSLKVIQPNMNSFIKHTHRYIERIFLNKHHKSNENNTSLLFSENQTFSYIIYSRKSKNEKFNCEAWSANNNIHFDKMNKDVLNIINTQSQIIKRLSQKEIINRLENIGNKIYVISFYGITDANGRLNSIIALFFPINEFIKLNDFVYNNEFNNNVSVLSGSTFNEIFKNKDNGTSFNKFLLGNNSKKNGRVYSKSTKNNCSAWTYYEPLDIVITSNSTVDISKYDDFLKLQSNWVTIILITSTIIIALLIAYIMSNSINKQINEYFNIFKALVNHNYDRCKKLINDSIGEKKGIFWSNRKTQNENLEKIQSFISKKNNIDVTIKQSNDIVEKNNNFRKIINETYININRLIDFLGEMEKHNLISHINKLEHSMTLIDRNILILSDKLESIKKNISLLNNLEVTTNILSINFSILKQQIGDKNINEYTNSINSVNNQIHSISKQFNNSIKEIEIQTTTLINKFNNMLTVVDTMKLIEQKSDKLFSQTKNKIENLKQPLLFN
jgi:hypothetical protein